MSCNWNVTFGRWLSNEWNWVLTCVNAIPSLYCCIYFMHDLHHNLMDYCDYLMMQSYLWQMMLTRANGDDVLDVPEGSATHGRGRGQFSHGNAPPPPPRPPVSLEQLLATQIELMTLSFRTRHVVGQSRHNTPDART
jgi:hypothetical protein